MFEKQLKRNFYPTVKFLVLLVPAFCLVFTSACQNISSYFPKTVASKSLRDVPAQRLNYNFEADVPLPATNDAVKPTEKFAAVQKDFDERRPIDELERTIFSPDKQRILAVYRKPNDLPGAFWLDIYSADGKFLKQVTPNNLSLVFPDAMQWSPDSNSVAFVGLGRTVTEPDREEITAPTPPDVPETPDANANLATNSNAENTNQNNVNQNEANAKLAPQPTPRIAPVAAFKTEQIYLVDREGSGLKPITQKEGLIYFALVWSPDSTALAALACRNDEWSVRSEEFPNKLGRPRIIEKNGRERLLDDNLTDVLPVWSPDSSKVAEGYGTEVKIYDSLVETPTYAVIPLKVPLFNSSQAFDENIRRQQKENANSVSNANAASGNKTNTATNANVASPANQLPSSFNPIVKLIWAEDKTLFFQTGYVRSYNNEITRSYMRWHRLDLSSQTVALK